MFFACVSQRSGFFFQLTDPQLGSQQSTGPGRAVGRNLTSIPNLPTLPALGKTVGSASRVSCSYSHGNCCWYSVCHGALFPFPFPSRGLRKRPACSLWSGTLFLANEGQELPPPHLALQPGQLEK